MQPVNWACAPYLHTWGVQLWLREAHRLMLSFMLSFQSTLLKPFLRARITTHLQLLNVEISLGQVEGLTTTFVARFVTLQDFF